MAEPLCGFVMREGVGLSIYVRGRCCASPRSAFTQVVIDVETVAATNFLILAHVNVERLQVERHRAFMLKAWFYIGTRTD